MSEYRFVRAGCRGYVEGAVGASGQRMCARCGKNRGMHRRVRVLHGKGETMSAQSVSICEAMESAEEHRKAAVVDAMKVLLLADPGAAITVQVTDVLRWAQLKAIVRPSKVGLVGTSDSLRLHEAFICRIGDIVYNLSGPPFYPSREEYNRMLDERDELDPFAAVVR